MGKTRIDWEGRGNRIGIVVEGENDRKILEGFLNGGQAQGFWEDWTQFLFIKSASGLEGVLYELREQQKDGNALIYGIVDRDWRTFDENQALEAELSQLRILERIMIENYLIDPDDLVRCLPPSTLSGEKETRLRSLINEKRQDWIKHGILSRVMHENGAHDFCRGNQSYPKALLYNPLPDETIRQILEGWQQKLDPDYVLSIYSSYQQNILTLSPTDHYKYFIDGKNFFNEVIVTALNDLFGQNSRDNWISRLLQVPSLCPPDLKNLFEPLLSQT